MLVLQAADTAQVALIVAVVEGEFAVVHHTSVVGDDTVLFAIVKKAVLTRAPPAAVVADPDESASGIASAARQSQKA